MMLKMPQHDDTIRPPSPPRSRRKDLASLGLWIVCSPDVERIGTVVPLGRKPIEVGRGEAATEQLHDDWLSRQHFQVGVQPGRDPQQGPWWLADSQTRNGTFVNGTRQRRCELHLGDVIRAGATVAIFDRGAAQDAENLGLIGVSEATFVLRLAIRRAALGTGPVHIHGESGAGKEVVAAAMHHASGRRGEYLALNMAAVVDNLAESQLFGHRRGAFSGAGGDQQGAFDAADGGTLLLDEIGELGPAVQAKLLRVVETNEVHRLGDARPHKVDVRLLTATHRDLRAMVDRGKFREDLFWRLAHTQLHVAPLRDRRLDVWPLLEHFLRTYGQVTLSGVIRLQTRWAWHVADLLDVYLRYDWPGNVRELRDEARSLADAMAARHHDAITGPIPPLEDALSPRLKAATTHANRPAPVVIDSGHHQVIDMQAQLEEAARVQALLDDPEALLNAIRFEADGKIKRFAEYAGAVLGKSVASARRSIYRSLGDRVAELRKSD